MAVYYSPSLWSKDKGPCGLPQRVNWQFQYAGTKHCIPFIYRFPKGIVFDLITFLDEAKLREFFDRYEAIEEKMTPLQRRCAEQEHPYQAMRIKELYINGKQVEGGYSSSSSVSIPWARQGDELTSVRKAYSDILEETDSFACERYCVPYPETASNIQRFLRFLRLDKVKSLKLSTHSIHRFSALDVHFEMMEEDQKMICFKHPITGIIHTMYFQNAELAELPFGADRKRSIYTMQSMYEIDPALPQGDTLQFSSSIQYIEPEGDGLKPAAASSIGIIGGAGGPSSIFVTGTGDKENIPRGLHGLPLYSCFSIPSFQKDDVRFFALEGINTRECDGKEYIFQIEKNNERGRN